jgi:YbbR domain-containing protein
LRETRKADERGLLARIVLENYPLKLLALCLAVSLYLLVHDDEYIERKLSCDVVARLPPIAADRVLVSDPPSEVQLTLRGERTRLMALRKSDLQPIQMDLRTHDQATYKFDVRSITAPASLQVVQVDPSRVSLSWRPRVQREVPVRVELHGRPKRGLEARVLDVSGERSFVVSGPQDQVERAATQYTHEATVVGLGAGTYQVQAALKPLADHLSYVTSATPAQARIEVRSASVSDDRGP